MDCRFHTFPRSSFFFGIFVQFSLSLHAVNSKDSSSHASGYVQSLKKNTFWCSVLKKIYFQKMNSSGKLCSHQNVFSGSETTLPNNLLFSQYTKDSKSLQVAWLSSWKITNWGLRVKKSQRAGKKINFLPCLYSVFIRLSL